MKELLFFVVFLVTNSQLTEAFRPTRSSFDEAHSASLQQQCRSNWSQCSYVINTDRQFSTKRLSERLSGGDGGEDIENDQDGSGNTKGWIERRQIDDYGLIVGDIFAVIIASQLMGLLDVLNDPEFSRQGGWLQPIPAVPSTLGTLVERISTLSLLWLAAAFSEEESYSFTAIEDEKSSILVALTIAVNFVALRCILEVILGFATGSNFDGDILENARLGLALRDCYFVVLGLPAFRFLYTKYLVRR